MDHQNSLKKKMKGKIQQKTEILRVYSWEEKGIVG